MLQQNSYETRGEINAQRSSCIAGAGPLESLLRPGDITSKVLKA